MTGLHPFRLLCRIVGLGIAASVACAWVADILGMMVTGTLVYTHPLPHYPPMQVPWTEGAHGADVAHIYFASRALFAGRSSAYPGDLAPDEMKGPGPSGHRFISNAPPAIHIVCVPISRMRYRDALTLDLFLQPAFLLLLAALLLRGTGGGRHVAAAAAAMGGLLFFTPIGLSHMERGQYDIWAAAFYLAALAAVYRPGIAWPLVAGFLGALKWTSLPLLATMIAPAAAFWGRDMRRLAWAPAAFAAATLVGWRELPDFLGILWTVEGSYPAWGITLSHFLPRSAGKIAVLLAAAAVSSALLHPRHRGRRTEAFCAAAFPFAAAIALLAVCCGHSSSEIRTVALVGLLPAAFPWCEAAPSVPARLKTAVAAAFGLCLLVVFRTGAVNLLFLSREVSSEALTLAFAGFAAFFLGTALWILSRPAGPVLAAPAPS